MGSFGSNTCHRKRTKVWRLKEKKGVGMKGRTGGGLGLRRDRSEGFLSGTNTPFWIQRTICQTTNRSVLETKVRVERKQRQKYWPKRWQGSRIKGQHPLTDHDMNGVLTSRNEEGMGPCYRYRYLGENPRRSDKGRLREVGTVDEQTRRDKQT